ncbi:glycoside hydrolase family 92 protein, partial [Enterococcus faecium]|nr:glycoside hydrolase family 92 protein [Enterococcus faecium]
IHKIKRMDKEYTKLYFTHQDLLKGGTISYQLGIIPHPKKYQAKDLPFSLSNYN